MVNKMNALREKYAELKRTCKSQITEIKSLRTERVAILGKLENDARYTLTNTENDELIQKYKSRISDLENKLKSEIKRNSDSKESNCSDASFRYKVSIKLHFTKFCNNHLCYTVSFYLFVFLFFLLDFEN